MFLLHTAVSHHMRVTRLSCLSSYIYHSNVLIYIMRLQFQSAVNRYCRKTPTTWCFWFFFCLFLPLFLIANRLQTHSPSTQQILNILVSIVQSHNIHFSFMFNVRTHGRKMNKQHHTPTWTFSIAHQETAKISNSHHHKIIYLNEIIMDTLQLKFKYICSYSPYLIKMYRKFH